MKNLGNTRLSAVKYFGSPTEYETLVITDHRLQKGGVILVMLFPVGQSYSRSENTSNHPMVSYISSFLKQINNLQVS